MARWREGLRACLLLSLPSCPLAILPASVSAQDARPTAAQEIESFRESILTYFGFTESAAAYLRGIPLEIQDWSSNTGGGSWDPVNKVIHLKTLQQEAAVGAFAMAWWDQRRLEDTQAPLRLARAVVRLARRKSSTGVSALARSYVAGDSERGWAGYFCGDGGRCADLDGLGAPDFDFSPGAPRARVLDREIFAGLAAWTMGRYRSGSRALPRELWEFYEPLFTGKIFRTPYYEGGVP